MADNFYAKYSSETSGGGGGGGVTSLNSLTGALTLAAGTGITITPSGGNTLTIDATGGSGANTALSNLVLPTAINRDLVFAKTGLSSNAAVQTKDNAIASTKGISFKSGDAGAGFSSGFVTLVSGNGQVSSGALTIGSGGQSTGTDTNTGMVTVKTGDTDGAGNSGNILLSIGASAATRGKIQFVDGSEGTSGYVWTSTDTSGSGTWMLSSGGGANTALSNLTTTSINQNFTFDTGATVFVQTKDDVTADTQSLIVKTGDAGGGQNSGTLDLISGGAEGTSGNVEIASGGGLATNSPTGVIQIQTGAPTGSGASGLLSLATGNSPDSGVSGEIDIGTGSSDTGGTGQLQVTTGNAGTSGDTGNMTHTTGSTQSGNSGRIAMLTGNSSADGDTGQLLFITGDSSGGNSGNISLTIGSATGTKGQIKFVDGTEGTSGYVWTSTDTVGSGSWMPASGGGGSPAGANGDIQFNNSGSFGADANFFWDNTNKRLGVFSGAPRATLEVNGTAAVTNFSTLPDGTISGVFLLQASNNPIFLLCRSVNSTDAKMWDGAITSDGVFSMRAVNDTFSGAQPWITATGSASAITSVVIPQGNFGVGTPTPGSTITAVGVIESTTGGFKFPDATTQTTAFTGGATGTFTTVDLKTVTVVNGLITSIV